MDGCSRKGEACPQLLDLIPNGREWLVRRHEESFGSSEEKKLELRLGPPGEDWFIEENNKNHRRDMDESLLSLGCFSSMASNTHNNNNNNTSAGAKRGFLDTVQAKAEETWMINNNGNPNQKHPSPWSSGSSQSLSPSAFLVKTQQQQQQSKTSFLQFPQSLSVMTKESSQSCSTKVVELQNPEKKASSPTSASVSANTAMPNGSQKRTAPAPVVGWPPVRSFRKNLASGSPSKPAPESQNAAAPTTTNVTNGKSSESCKKGLFVKINMDGVPIGRKVDLAAYDSYEKLSSAVDELFRDLLAAQRDPAAAGNQSKTEQAKEIKGLAYGGGEYTLVYEDNEGDRMLVGDVPWHMFVSTVKRLRVLETSKLSAFCLGGSSKQEKTPLDSGGR